MVKIPDAANKVPMMFRAQSAGRCQLQRILPERKKNQEPQDAEKWASEWVIKTYPTPPKFGENIQSRRYTLTWRFVTNSGQDDGIIRPAIGAYGWPYYPGSSMKGIFRSACTTEQTQHYCGIEESYRGGDCIPGILRFHGGYPTDSSWQDNLVDIVHPQQDWQVKAQRKNVGAFALISLSAPELEFGISSTIVLDDQEWKEIWQIWEKALSKGIGCRVSSGYGQVKETLSPVIYSCHLHGRGMAPTLLNNEAEFRPNILRGTIRSHALRIFGGLTDADKAQKLVQQLFGGIDNGGEVGLLGIKFETSSIKIDKFGKSNYAAPTYNVEGKLSWLLTQKFPKDQKYQKELLEKLIKGLTRFAMVFGGFGKSWRRADHRLFFPEYYEGKEGKSLIGCHWSWRGKRSLRYDVRVRKLEKIGQFIDQEVRQVAIDWMELQGVTPSSNNCADWREAWHPERVQVWGRLAREAEDCEAIAWLHQAYRSKMGKYVREGSIYKSSVTGFVGKETQIGRLWHRMYPVVALKKDPEHPNQPIMVKTSKFLELLTLFPDNSREFEDFLHFLKSEQKMFQLLWGK